MRYIRPELRIESGKQFLDLHIPRPEKIIGDLSEMFNVVRQGSDNTERFESRLQRIGTGIEDFTSVRTGIEDMNSFTYFLDRQGIRLEIERIKFTPVSFLCNGPSLFPLGFHFFIRPFQEFMNMIFEAFDDLLMVSITIFEDDHPLVIVFEMFLHPDAKTGKVCRNGGNTIRCTLKGRIPPGFIV